MSTPDTAVVERRDLEVRAEASGTVEPVIVVEVKSRASGEVLRMNVETGDEVEQGALLAEIDPRDVKNALAQAEADLDVARARVTTAEAQARRTAELRQANVVTQQENETAALEEADARAQLVKARTNLELARERRNDVTIRAPISGTIIEKSVEEGQIIASASQNVSGGTTLLRMADLAEMQVRALVDEVDVGGVATEQPARVSVEAYPGRVFTGRVLKIEPQAVVEQNVTMFPVLIRLENRDRLLRPGMNAEVEIEIARRADAVVVPNAAVVSPRDALAAAATLGLDESAVRSALDATRGATAARQRASGATPSGGSPAGPEGAGRASPITRSAPAARSVSTPDGMASAAEGRASAAAEADSARTVAAPAEAAAAGVGGAQPGPGAVRPGIVFLAGETGPEPRIVRLGLSDWDYTEVVSGLEPGQRVVLVSVARLQQQQQEFEQRMRQRSGSPFGGGGSQSQPSRPAGER
jgi:HlyD family secretion protein